MMTPKKELSKEECRKFVDSALETQRMDAKAVLSYLDKLIAEYEGKPLDMTATALLGRAIRSEHPELQEAGKDAARYVAGARFLRMLFDSNKFRLFRAVNFKPEAKEIFPIKIPGLEDWNIAVCKGRLGSSEVKIHFEIAPNEEINNAEVFTIERMVKIEIWDDSKYITIFSEEREEEK
ncbi:hypothetical protein [Sedimentisphaera salicampi]|uniref:hypothetical protein n=1 Tax=Sedimentisphaera salicampi TaxID=1941349 RepID=UPI000B9CA55E|nr:hypothetical protein [Sedimentisphaera salicampi]OXU15409.1 hypothetical protein SMSP1_00890 [Sedimentisphaera salicampi]